MRDGDYLEFGLFKGYSFWFAQKAARDRRLETMRFFGFDSFAGLPDVHGIDKTPTDDSGAALTAEPFFAYGHDGQVFILHTEFEEGNHA